jgi:hypothetical protein
MTWPWCRRAFPQEQIERAVHKDGEHVYLSLKFLIADTTTGAPYALCSISTDITEREVAEAERRRLLADLENQTQQFANGAGRNRRALPRPARRSTSP